MLAVTFMGDGEEPEAIIVEDGLHAAVCAKGMIARPFTLQDGDTIICCRRGDDPDLPESSRSSHYSSEAVEW
jgi:hypothetical protein